LMVLFGDITPRWPKWHCKHPVIHGLVLLKKLPKNIYNSKLE
jgi:hypothetical protein